MNPALSDELNALVAQYQQPLCRYAAGIVHDPDGARDLVQEAFVKYLRHRHSDPTPIDNPGAWLYRVTHNLALDHRRKYGRLSPLEATTDPDAPQDQLADEHASDPAAQLQRREATALAWQCLDQLNERERQMVLLKVMEEKSYKEIAAIMELSVTNVGFILHVAMKKLAVALHHKLR